MSLAGRHILVTRPADDGDEWVRGLAARGAVPVSLPCLETVARDDAATRELLRSALARADELVFTAPRAVACTAALLAGTPVPDAVTISAVGATTAQAAREAFGRVDRVGTGHGAADLAREILAEIGEDEARRFLVPGSSRAHWGLEDVLAPAGHVFTRVTVYETRPAAPREPRIRLADQAVDTVLLASPSAVEGLLNQAELPAVVRLVSIGPTTSDAIRRRGLAVAAEARTPSLEGLLEVIP